MTAAVGNALYALPPGPPSSRSTPPTATSGRGRSRRTRRPPTYHDAFWSFVNFCDQENRPALRRADLPSADRALEFYFDKLFFDGENPHVGETLIAAFGYHTRWSTKGALPRARRALKGWKVVVPDHARDPIPWEAVLFIIEDLLDDSDDMAPFAACALLIEFDCYVLPAG